MPTIYGFGTRGVFTETMDDYNVWGGKEKVLHEDDSMDDAYLEWLQNAKKGNDPRFTDETYCWPLNYCADFAGAAIKEVEKPCSK